MKNRILLLSAYDARSHSQWRTTLAQMFADYDWTQLALPPRHFNWRVRGNSLSWGFGDYPPLTQKYNLIIATSMVDLASLRGFIPSLAAIPTLVYFHENQFAYPLSPGNSKGASESRLDAQMVSLYSALCADLVVFNSQYNKDSFLKGVSGLLKKLPDLIPSGLLARLEKAHVVAVPLPFELPLSMQQRPCVDNGETVLNVAWNHRWEFDKGPGLLLELIQKSCNENLPIRWFIMGERFREQPAEFDRIEALLQSYTARYPDRHGHLGYIENFADYYASLRACDVVLSTSLHDFQGLSIIEACILGCTPLVPEALVYPEYLDKKFLYPDNRFANGTTVEQVIARLKQWANLKKNGTELPKADMRRFQPSALKKDYLALFEGIWSGESKK